jgi:hypothetical protein
VSRQDLVTWLQQQIAEQKRIDATTSGVVAPSDLAQSVILSKELPASSDVQLILPGDAKKQRKQTKQMFLDRGKLHGRVHRRLQVDLRSHSVRDGGESQVLRPGRPSSPRSRRNLPGLRRSHQRRGVGHGRRGVACHCGDLPCRPVRVCAAVSGICVEAQGRRARVPTSRCRAGGACRTDCSLTDEVGCWSCIDDTMYISVLSIIV